MEASTGPRHRLPAPPSDLTADRIKQKLLKSGVNPSPKIIHTLRKKHLQKSFRKSKRNLSSEALTLTESQQLELAEEGHFQAIKSEYKRFTRSVAAKSRHGDGAVMVGQPWEGLERVALREMANSSAEYMGNNLKREHLRELGEFLERDRERFRWLLDDDVELQEGWMEKEKREWAPPKRRGGEAETIRFLVDKLSGTDLGVKDWKFSKMMKQSELQFTETQLLKIVGMLGDKGLCRHALSVVEWVYSSKEHRFYKSRFVYTKLLAVLGKAQRPHEALQIFDLMREDGQTYPDMPAYHSIAVTLGQAGYLKDLINIIETMREKPSKRIKNVRYKNWDPALQPDIVIFNAVLNACVPSHQWRGVSWVFQQLRKNSLKPNGATYGLAMEVMLHSGKYDLVHKFFEKMKRSGEAPKALTYRVLVKSLWEEGKVDEAVEAVRDMEKRGIVGAACVYYELACCLCKNGRCEEAMMEVEKLKELPHAKPLEVTFTGMIMSCMEGGHVEDCISIFQQSKDHCAAGIGMINAMLKVYGSNDMFSKARELFEKTNRSKSDSSRSLNGFGSTLSPDAYTYTTMLKASASAGQWEYFEFVYREMVLSGYGVDQSKHVSLLAEASRAGKWHLLEHAFDAVLEAGEIPHQSFFTELICQATIHRNFERAICIINALAYMPSQMSEKQWTDLFERNRDRIGMENLIELSEILSCSELPVEASVSNMTRSLVSYCRFYKGKEVISSDGNAGMNFFPINSLGTSTCDDLHDDCKSCDHGVVRSISDAEDAADLSVSRSSAVGSNEERGVAKLGTADDDLDVDELCGEFDDGGDDKLLRRFDLDSGETVENVPSGNLGASEGTAQPSANEILESWKQSREKDGTFLSFQLGGY